MSISKGLYIKDKITNCNSAAKNSRWNQPTVPWLQGAMHCLLLPIILKQGSMSRYVPGDVSPGHIMCAPDNINLIAPLSTCCCGQINGSTNQT